MGLLSESLNLSNAPNTAKQIKLYPKMALRLGQHLLRANPKTENLRLFALYSYYFLICCLAAHDQLLDIIEETVLVT